MFDKSASVSDRDDAAMYLSAFDSNEVVEALLKVGEEESVEDVILYSVGEPLTEIWLRNNNFNFITYNGLCTTTKFAIKENMELI